MLLERGRLGDIFGEWAGNPSALGKLAGADFLCLVSLDGRTLSLVDAVTDRWLGSEPAGAPRDALAKLIANRRSNEGSTVALLGEGDLAPLRRWLAGLGCRVLDRSQSLAVLGERELGETGFAETTPRTPFLGARFLLVHRKNNLLVFASEGTLIQQVPLSDGMPSAEAREVLSKLLAPAPESLDLFSQQVAPEALIPFCRGIREFAAGRYAEATAEFQRSYEAANRFEPAYRWEAMCYAMLGLREFERALTRFADLGIIGRGAALGGPALPRDGWLFLGIEGHDHSDAPLAARASVEAVEGFPRQPLFLPESLALAREQFDLLARTHDTEGRRWETSGGFLVSGVVSGKLLPGSPQRVRLSFHETVTGDLLGRVEAALPRSPEEWHAALDLLIGGGEAPITVEVPRAAMDVRKAAARLGAAKSHADCNAAQITLLLADPTHPKAISTPFLKGSDEKDGLDNFVNYAKRDYLIARLPADHPLRPWLELERLQSFSIWPGNGHLLSGEPVDAAKEINAFSRIPDGHPSRAVARYFWLYDAQAGLPPEQLQAEVEALLAMIERTPDFPRKSDLRKVTRSWVHLARVINGTESSASRPADFHDPQRFRVEINGNGEPRVEWNDVLGFNRQGLSLFTEAEWKQECRVMVDVMGRGDRLLRIQPEWLEKYPDSFALAALVAWGGMKAPGADEGRPWILLDHPDPGAEFRHWPAMAEFVRRNLLRYFERVRTADEFAAVEARANYLIHRLNTRVFRNVVSDEEYSKWHAELRAASAAAARRARCPDATILRWDANMHDWRTLTREVSARRLANDLCVGPQFFVDFPELLKRERSAFDSAVRADARPSQWRSWWQAIDGEITVWLSPRELANLIASRLPGIHTKLGNGELFDDDRAMLLDCGLVLMHGRRDAEAEETLRRVAVAPAASSSDPTITRALRASALWHLARLLRGNGRRVDAISALQDCLAEYDGLHVRYLWRCQPNYRDWLLRIPQGASIGSLALRTLEEMRFDPAHAKFPPGLGAVQVRTPQLNNPELVVFYRTPQGEERARAALVVVPSVNEDVLAMIAPDSSWGKFADKHRLVLITPQFNGTDTHRSLGHAFTAHQNAQAWSGQALLDAVRMIRDRIEFDEHKLLLHGFGGGAQFFQSFARWKPDRTAALSAHSAATWSWLDGISGQQPLSALAGIPMLFTVGKLDDYALGESNRRASTAQLVTCLRAAGCNARLELIPGAAHVPTSEMESLAQSFLAEQL